MVDVRDSIALKPHGVGRVVEAFGGRPPANWMGGGFWGRGGGRRSGFHQGLITRRGVFNEIYPAGIFAHVCEKGNRELLVGCIPIPHETALTAFRSWSSRALYPCPKE